MAEQSGDKQDYEQFFEKKLQKYLDKNDVSALDQLPDDERDNLFLEVDKEWSSDKEEKIESALKHMSLGGTIKIKPKR